VNAPPHAGGGEPAPGAERGLLRGDRALLLLVVAAVCWRWLLAMRTPVPAEDGVNYLWMAQRFAAGDAAAALSEPFSPLWPLLLALPIAAGAEPFLAGQVLGCIAGGLALLPIAAIGERLRRGAGLPAAALCAVSSVFARTAPEVLTEPLFVLVVGIAVACGLAGRWWWLGVGTGLAFWVRPEGVLCALPFVLLWPSRAWRALVGTAAAVALLGAWRWLCGHGFDPVPKLQFHALRTDLGDERGDWLSNLLAVPPVFLEAFGGAALLAVLSLLPDRERAPDADARRQWLVRQRLVPWLLLACAVLPIATFVVRRRFFVAWAPAVLPLAGVTLARVVWLRGRARELLLTAVCALDLWTAWNGTIAADRRAERFVGRYLARVLPPGHTVVGDMTRVLWFAGQRPLPPRHFDAEWFLAAARAPEVEFVVMNERGQRGVFATVEQGLRDAFVRFDLPVSLRAVAEARGVTVFVRK